MRVTLLKNSEEIASKSYGANEVVTPDVGNPPDRSVFGALYCFRDVSIPADVASVLFSEKNMQSYEDEAYIYTIYTASMGNGDGWKIIVVIPFCSRCKKENDRLTPVDNEGELCREHKREWGNVYGV